MVVPHVLFLVYESGGDSICQFACFLFQVTKLLFHDLPWIFDTDHLILQVPLLRLKLPNFSAKLLSQVARRLEQT